MTIVAGNWKMHKTRREASALVRELAQGQVGLASRARLRVYPPFIALAEVVEAAGGAVEVGAQNFHPEPSGAFTGEVSARMILEAGATHVLVGHSERRTHFTESDDFLARKVAAGLAAGLSVLYCIGEKLEQREAGRTDEVLAGQLDAGLAGLPREVLARLEVAYEPIWAIGTGRVAELAQVTETHRFIRRHLTDGWPGGEGIPLLYGGSVQPSNAAALLEAPGVDGVLVGGASLDAQGFLAIAAAAPPRPSPQSA